jgi:hypothetical protein
VSVTAAPDEALDEAEAVPERPKRAPRTSTYRFLARNRRPFFVVHK